MRRPTVSAWAGTRSRPPNSVGRVRARLRMQGDDARAALQARARLVEGDVAVVAEAEDGEVDGRLVELPLVAVALGGRIRGRAVETVERADRDAGELTLQVGGEAALVAAPEAAVLVELEHRGLLARQLAADGVCAQRRVDAERRAPGGEEHAQARARAQAVGDQLGRGLRDRVRAGEHQRGRAGRERCGQPRPQPRMPAMSSVEARRPGGRCATPPRRRGSCAGRACAPRHRRGDRPGARSARRPGRCPRPRGRRCRRRSAGRRGR